MNRREFFEQIKEGFFSEQSADFESFKNMIGSATPVFGTLDAKIIEKEEGGKTITFIDVDKAKLVFVPEGVNANEINTDMTTTIMTLHLNKDNVIEVVEHNFGIFTPANKEQVLLFSSLIGKKILFK